MIKAVTEAEAAAGIRRDGSAVFSHPFVMEVLDAALLFGRERYPQLLELVVSVGEAFVEPLLDRISLAENRTLRRFYFDCLSELGGLVRAPALQRLHDGRWFVLRNLIILLRAFPDLEVQRAVRKFADHPHPRVRSEALKSLIRFHTPGVERLLLRELDSSDRMRQMVAVQLAELTPSQAITQRLVAFLRKSSFGNYDLSLKEAVVATLAAIGGGGVLTELERLLRSHSLLHPGKHRRLQIEVLRSLARSPHTAARGLGAKFNIRSLGLPDTAADSAERDWGTS